MPSCALCTDMTPRVAQPPGLQAMPTVGYFVPGYLLIVPRAHVTNFGRLDTATLAEADCLIAALSARLTAVYGLPVLGFEYGLNAIGTRRVEHAHWHLMPSRATLGEWPAERLPGKPVGALTDLPGGPGSYVAVRGQDGAPAVHDLGGPVDERRRLRLRRLVAELDPRVDAATWTEPATRSANWSTRPSPT